MSFARRLLSGLLIPGDNAPPQPVVAGESVFAHHLNGLLSVKLRPRRVFSTVPGGLARCTHVSLCIGGNMLPLQNFAHIFKLTLIT